MIEVEKIRNELNNYIVGSFSNKETGKQKCKKCDKDVVDLKKYPQALDMIKIYREHERNCCK